MTFCGSTVYYVSIAFCYNITLNILTINKKQSIAQMRHNNMHPPCWWQFNWDTIQMLQVYSTHRSCQIYQLAQSVLPNGTSLTGYVT